jgi:hypothetical protein
LFITIDQLRADVVAGALHGLVPTPALDRLRVEGTRFADCLTAALPCGPARAGLMTGLHAFTHRAIRNGSPLARHHATLGTELRKLGREPLLLGYGDIGPDPGAHHPADPDMATYELPAPGFREIVQMWFEAPLDWIGHLRRRGYALPEPLPERWYDLSAPWQSWAKSSPYASPQNWYNCMRQPVTAYNDINPKFLKLLKYFATICDGKQRLCGCLRVRHFPLKRFSCFAAVAGTFPEQSSIRAGSACGGARDSRCRRVVSPVLPFRRRASWGWPLPRTLFSKPPEEEKHGSKVASASRPTALQNPKLGGPGCPALRRAWAGAAQQRRRHPDLPDDAGALRHGAPPGHWASRPRCRRASARLRGALTARQITSKLDAVSARPVDSVAN